ERAVDVRLNLAPLGALTARVVEVVHHDHARGRDGLDVVPPPVRAGAMAVDGPGLRADQRGHGVADHRAHLGKEGADVRREVAGFPRTHLERLDGVRDAGARDLAERVDLLSREHGHGSLLVECVEHRQIVPLRFSMIARFRSATAASTLRRFGLTLSARWKYSSASSGLSSAR